MPTVNNATGVYATLGYNFNDPNGDVHNFSANSQAHLSTIPPLVSAWQAQDIVNNDVGGYFQNPTSPYINTIINIANSIVQLYQSSNGISNLDTVYNSANTLVTTAQSFLSHTDRLSGVTPWTGDDTVPYYQSALNFGKTAVYITNQTDGIINNSPILGSFTSILVVPQIQSSANTISSSNTIIFNSIASGPDGNGNTVFSTTLSTPQLNQIVSDFSNTITLLSGRQSSDVTYFTNLKSFVAKFNTLKQFSNLGETGEELITKFIGTDKIKTNLAIDSLSNVPYTPNANTSNGSSGGSTSAATQNVSDVINSILAQSSAAYVNSNNASNLANSFSVTINSSYNQANTGTTIAQAAYSQANSAYILAQEAYNTANSIISLQSSINLTQNTNIAYANTLAQAAFTRANNSTITFNGTTGTALTSNGILSLTSTNGVTITGSANQLLINTSQNLQSNSSPTFNSLSLTNALSITQGGTGATSATSALTNLLPSGTTAGYVLTTGGPGTFYWAAGGSGGGGGGATPGTTINTTRQSYTANGSGLAYTTPTYIPGTNQLRVYFDGLRQFASEYTETNGTVCTFNTAPASGVIILFEVDGYILNPYYANNISFTAPFGSIVSTANTIQLAIQDIETRKATLNSPTFTGTALAPTPAITSSNTQIATTGFVRSILPAGVILMWSGSIASVPSGWYLCDGTNGTPDLRDRFLVGAGTTYTPGNTGGSKDATLVSHSHTASTGLSDPGHSHGVYDPGHGHGPNGSAYVLTGGAVEFGGFQSGGAFGESGVSRSTGTAGAGTGIGIYGAGTGMSASTSIGTTGNSATNANLPPYYALAYIMKS